MTLLFRLRESKNLKTILRIFICIFAFLYVFSLPSFSGRPIFQYISYALMILFAGFTFAYSTLYKVYRNISFRYAMVSIPIFVLWSLIGTVFFSHQFRSWLTLLLLLLSFVVFYFSFACIKNIGLVIKIFVVALFAFSIYYIIHYRADFIDIKNLGTKRLGDFFDNENAIGGYMSIGLSLCLYIVVFFSKKRELFYICPLIAFFLVGVSTGSRAFFIISIFAIFVCFFVRFRRKKWIFLIVSAVLLVLIIVLLQLPFMAAIKERLISMITTFEGTDADKSSITRVLWQKYAFYLGFKNPIIGYGSFGFTYYSGVGTYSHGNLGEVFCNFGIVGVLAFYFIPVWSFLKCIRWKNNLKAVIILFFVYYILTSFMTVNYFHKDTYVVFALILFITCELNETKKAKTKIEKRKRI